MVKWNIIEDIDKMIEGERIDNPGFQNLEIARAMAGQELENTLKPLLRNDVEKLIVRYYGKIDLAKQFIKIQPIYYDESKNWWLWHKGKFCWVLTDEVDIINWIKLLADINSVNSKERNEILEALKQEGRLNKPKDIEPTWIQFKDEVFDILTGQNFEATPEYFVTNPIPYALDKNNCELTPIMDKIFEEWVGKDYVKTLYEIIAYCLLPSYPIHRLFCFVGGGMNGKSKFLELLRKFVGGMNCCSTELDTLITSRFEITRLHKKLVCQMGETNFAQLEKTSIIKKLTGGDLIGFEYKNKNPFEECNYAKIILATNNLPETTDKTIGFYRRWQIIDFPNQFSEQRDILKDIPEEEYENLALKCTGLLKDLLKNRKFTNEGSIDDRMKRYEEKSNPFDKFIRDKCLLENPDEFVFKFEFEKAFNQWCKENRFREFSEKSIAEKMKEHKIETGRKNAFWLNDNKGGYLRCWMGICWK